MKLFLKRLIAYWLDFVMLATLLIGLQWTLYTITAGFPFDYLEEGYQIELWVLLTVSLPVWFYFIFSELKKQRTFGKRIFKLIVTNESGSKISFKQALLRTFVRLLPWEITHIIILIPKPWWGIDNPQNTYFIFVPNIIIVTYILVLLLTKGNKAVHDYISQTRVKEMRTHY